MVRNFWVEVEIDGRKTKLCGGPRAKDGGMTIRLYQRDAGQIVRAFVISCEVRNEELLTAVHKTHPDSRADGVVSTYWTTR